MNTWDFFLNKFGRKNDSNNIIPDDNTTDNESEDGGIDASTLHASSAFTVGSGDAIAIITGKDPLYRLWIGSKNPVDAAFSVDKDGNTIMNKGTFKGNITVGGANNQSGVFTVLGPTENKRVVIDNSGIVIIGENGGSYYFKETESGAVQGSLTYDSTFGVYLTTAAGKLATFFSDGIYGCGSLSSRAEIIGEANVWAKANTGWAKLTAATGASEVYGYTTATVLADTGNAILQSGSASAKVLGANTAVLYATDGIVSVRADGDYIHLTTALSAGSKILLQSGGNIDLTVADGYYLTTDREEMYFRNNKILSMLGSLSVPASGTTLTINGSSKTAIVPTKKGYKALYTNESPNVWFNDFAKIIRPKWYEFWKKPIVVADETFIEVTSGPYHLIPTMNKDIVQIWGIRKGFEKVRFEDKTKEEFEKNNKFWSTPTI